MMSPHWRDRLGVTSCPKRGDVMSPRARPLLRDGPAAPGLAGTTLSAPASPGSVMSPGSVCTPFITMSHTLERWPPGMGSWLRGLRAASSWSPLAQVAQLLQAFQRAQHGTARAMAMRRDGVDRRPRAAPVVVIRPSRQIHQHELLRQAQPLVLQLPRPLLRRPAHRASSPRLLASWRRPPMRSPNVAARHSAHTTSRHATIEMATTAATVRPISGAPAATARRACGMQQHRQQVRAGDPHT